VLPYVVVAGPPRRVIAGIVFGRSAWSRSTEPTRRRGASPLKMPAPPAITIVETPQDSRARILFRADRTEGPAAAADLRSGRRVLELRPRRHLRSRGGHRVDSPSDAAPIPSWKSRRNGVVLAYYRCMKLKKAPKEVASAVALSSGAGTRKSVVLAAPAPIGTVDHTVCARRPSPALPMFGVATASID